MVFAFIAEIQVTKGIIEPETMTVTRDLTDHSDRSHQFTLGVLESPKGKRPFQDLQKARGRNVFSHVLRGRS